MSHRLTVIEPLSTRIPQKLWPEAGRMVEFETVKLEPFTVIGLVTVPLARLNRQLSIVMFEPVI